VGLFSVADAVPIDELNVPARLVPPAAAAGAIFETLHLSHEQAVDLGHGKRIADARESPAGRPLAAVAPDGRLVGLVEFSGGVGRSVVNFPPDDPVPSPPAGSPTPPAPADPAEPVEPVEPVEPTEAP
jgi:tRNA pseudouridine55 synthase